MPPAGHFSAQERQVWRTFLEASQLLDRRMELRLRADTGLTHPQFEILLHLDKAPDGRLRMWELGERMVTTKSGLTYQITQLVKAGLVRRATCAPDDDRRGVNAEITERGRAAVAEAGPCVEAVAREHLLDVLSAEQLDALHEAMLAVRDRLRRVSPCVEHGGFVGCAE
jgi:DNA-binding MarR family transcriptional regulator